jgi:hypothetical protein
MIRKKDTLTYFVSSTNKCFTKDAPCNYTID